LIERGWLDHHLNRSNQNIHSAVAMDIPQLHRLRVVIATANASTQKLLFFFCWQTHNGDDFIRFI
jgi:hypothetical protein